MSLKTREQELQIHADRRRGQGTISEFWMQGRIQCRPMGSGSPKWRGYWGKRAKKHRLWGFWSLAIPATGLDEGVPTKSPDEEVTKISCGQPSPDSETGTHIAFI